MKLEEILNRESNNLDKNELVDIFYVDVADTPTTEISSILESAKKTYKSVSSKKILFAPVRGADTALKMSIANTLGSLPSLITHFFKEWKKSK